MNQTSCATVIPAYNAGSRINRTLEYLDGLAEHMGEVVIVDDASTDSTPDLIRQYLEERESKIRPIYREENGQKVGAIKDGVASLSDNIDYIILNDSDSRIQNPEDIKYVLEFLDENQYIGGTSFRIKPHKGKTIVSKLQRLMYTIDRSLYKFTSKKDQLRCASGAACLYRRKPLESALEKHSGRHAGDDFEMTLLVQKQDYGMRDFPQIEVETDVPERFWEHVKQQARWKQGGLETLAKERKFIFKNIRERKRLGAITAAEIAGWISLPTAAITGAYALREFDLQSLATAIATTYGSTTTILPPLLYYNRREIEDKKDLVRILPWLPFYYSAITPLSGLKAVFDITKSKFRKLSSQT